MWWWIPYVFQALYGQYFLLKSNVLCMLIIFANKFLQCFLKDTFCKWFFSPVNEIVVYPLNENKAELQATFGNWGWEVAKQLLPKKRLLCMCLFIVLSKNHQAELLRLICGDTIHFMQVLKVHIQDRINLIKSVWHSFSFAFSFFKFDVHMIKLVW